MKYLISALSIVFAVSSISFAAPKAKKNEIKDARDKQKYRTVVIDGRTWMADNLNYNVPGSTCYREDEDNCMVYGRLYSWEAAKSACQAGFRLPTNDEYKAFGKLPAAISMPVTCSRPITAGPAKRTAMIRSSLAPCPQATCSMTERMETKINSRFSGVQALKAIKPRCGI